jgi:putative intracellular protease/amidase
MLRLSCFRTPSSAVRLQPARFAIYCCPSSLLGKCEARLGAPAAPVETDPAIVTDLIERTLGVHRRGEARNPHEVRIGTARLHPGRYPGVQAGPVRSAKHAGNHGGDGGPWWLNDQLQAWLGEKNAADTLAQSHLLAETLSPDLVLVPGGTSTPGQMVDDDVLEWLRQVHQVTTWTTSVCSGALILAAAGILKGLPATTHWYKMGVLKIMGASPQRDQRIVRSGKVVTPTGVSAGNRLGPMVSRRDCWPCPAEAIQLVIEYDPQVRSIADT